MMEVKKPDLHQGVKEQRQVALPNLRMKQAAKVEGGISDLEKVLNTQEG